MSEATVAEALAKLEGEVAELRSLIPFWRAQAALFLGLVGEPPPDSAISPEAGDFRRSVDSGAWSVGATIREACFE